MDSRSLPLTLALSLLVGGPTGGLASFYTETAKFRLSSPSQSFQLTEADLERSGRGWPRTFGQHLGTTEFWNAYERERSRASVPEWWPKTLEFQTSGHDTSETIFLVSSGVVMPRGWFTRFRVSASMTGPSDSREGSTIVASFSLTGAHERFFATANPSSSWSSSKESSTS